MKDKNKFENFKLVKNKNSQLNVNDGIEKGGIYTLNSEIYMIKEIDLIPTINEYVGAYIARLIVGDNAPIIILLKGDDGKVYIASKFILGFKTLIDFFQENNNLPSGCFPYSCAIDANGSINILDYNDRESSLLSPIVYGAEAISVVMELIGYDDHNYYNRGVRINNDISLAVILNKADEFKQIFES